MKLPDLPSGDRFKDPLKLRVLGLAQGKRLFECWEDAIRDIQREAALWALEEAAKEAERMMRYPNDVWLVARGIRALKDALT